MERKHRYTHTNTSTRARTHTRTRSHWRRFPARSALSFIDFISNSHELQFQLSSSLQFLSLSFCWSQFTFLSQEHGPACAARRTAGSRTRRLTGPRSNRRLHERVTPRSRRTHRRPREHTAALRSYLPGADSTSTRFRLDPHSDPGYLLSERYSNLLLVSQSSEVRFDSNPRSWWRKVLRHSNKHVLSLLCDGFPSWAKCLCV